MDIVKQLMEMQDVEYGEFHSRLMPETDRNSIIGIRVPKLRKYAKDNAAKIWETDFCDSLPHYYYEENNLHMMLIGFIKDYDECICELEKFLPYVDNWATCDMPLPGCFKGHEEELRAKAESWIRSEHTYTVRYGIGVLMRMFLDEYFDEKYITWVAQIISSEYYVNMMIAWYMATALAKQWDASVKYVENKTFSVRIHNKIIQKAVESYRIDDTKKQYLRSLRIK